MSPNDIISATQVLAATKCLDRNMPFALYARPGEVQCTFQASGRCDSRSVNDFCSGASDDFAVSMFDNPAHCVVIPAGLTAKDILAGDFRGCEADLLPAVQSTDYTTYSSSVGALIAEMKADHSKTVVSRIIKCVGVDPVLAAQRYFKLFRDTFRYLYFTPQTGIWLGATPESLCSYNRSCNLITTMSLAGTRPAESEGEWDIKNVDEHRFVTDFICSVLKGNCSKVEVGTPFSLRYGAIEHLCERIEAHGVTDLSAIIAELSPTPAVCGTPRDVAMRRIRRVEHHERYCYGGWVGVVGDNVVDCYVNLRCALAGKGDGDTYIYNVYAGGGVTGQSDAADEWREADAKASALLSCIGQKSGCHSTISPDNDRLTSTRR
ncbi:MAG: hypothetical protein HFJ94_07305 [Muribaculaceae bacterium]|nr:hypothetical protein [Muribaculaceae bacterium]